MASQATRDAFNGVKTANNDTFFAEFQSAIKHPKLAVRGSDAHRGRGLWEIPWWQSHLDKGAYRRSLA